MKNYKLNAAPTAISKEQKGQKGSKAKRILIGVDAHVESYQAASKIDNGAVGVAQSFGSKEALLLRVEKQLQQAEGGSGGLRSGATGLQPVSGLKRKRHKMSGLRSKE